MHLQCCLLVTWLVPHETATVLACSAYIIKPCTISRHFMLNHIVHRVYTCSAVTCHLLQSPGAWGVCRMPPDSTSSGCCCSAFRLPHQTWHTGCWASRSRSLSPRPSCKTQVDFCVCVCVCCFSGTDFISYTLFCVC